VDLGVDALIRGRHAVDLVPSPLELLAQVRVFVGEDPAFDACLDRQLQHRERPG